MNIIDDIIEKSISAMPDTKELITSYRRFLQSKTQASGILVSSLMDATMSSFEDIIVPKTMSKTRSGDTVITDGDVRVVVREIKEAGKTKILTEMYENLGEEDFVKVAQVVEEINSEDFSIQEKIDENIQAVLKAGKNLAMTHVEGSYVYDLSQSVSVADTGELVRNRSLQVAQFLQSEIDGTVSAIDIKGQIADIDGSVQKLVESYQNNVILDSALESLNEVNDEFILNFADVSASVNHKLGELTQGSNRYMSEVNELLRTQGFSVMQKIQSLTIPFNKQADEVEQGEDFSMLNGTDDENFTGSSPMSSWINGINIDFSKPITAVVSGVKATVKVLGKLASGIWNFAKKGAKKLASKVVEVFIDPVDFIVSKGPKLDNVIDHAQNVIIPAIYKPNSIRSDSSLDYITPFGRIGFGFDEQGQVIMNITITPTTPITNISINNDDYEKIAYGLLPGLTVAADWYEHESEILGFNSFDKVIDNIFNDGEDAYAVDETIEDDGYWLMAIRSSQIRMSYLVGMISLRSYFQKKYTREQWDQYANGLEYGFSSNYPWFNEGAEVTPVSILGNFFPTMTDSGEHEYEFNNPLFRVTKRINTEPHFNTYSIADWFFQPLNDNDFIGKSANGSKTTNLELVNVLSNLQDLSSDGYGSWRVIRELADTSLSQDVDGMLAAQGKGYDPIFVPYTRRNRNLRYKYEIATDGKHAGTISKILTSIVVVVAVVAVGIAFVKIKKSLVDKSMGRSLKIAEMKRTTQQLDPSDPLFKSNIKQIRKMEKKHRKANKMASMIGVPGAQSVNAIQDTFDFSNPFSTDLTGVTSLLV